MDGRPAHGFGWFTLGSSAPSRGRSRRRRGFVTPKRYLFHPLTPQERRVIEQLRAERLAKEMR